ncbi:MAG: ATP-binding protein [Alphaproteobacteria bacterium]|nr:ATP-binding protein [Alphaproteobacteria bacterium]
MTHEQEQEVRRLEVLRDLDILDTEPELTFDRITRFCARNYRAPISLVSLVDEKRQWFKSAVGLDAKETPREQAFCAHAIHQDDIFFIPDATQDPRFADNPLVTGAPHIRTYVGAPLIARGDVKLGTLCLIYDEVTPISNETMDDLRDLACIVVDELELRQALTIAEHARRHAELADKAKSDFLAVMSHEIRTPLNGVLGMAEMLKSSNLAPDQAEMVETIASAGDALLDTLSKSLDLAKLDSGTMKVMSRPFKPAGLTAECIALFQGRAQQKGISLSMHSDFADGTMVIGDEKKISQILNNLISNAIKFTHLGGVRVHIRLAAKSEREAQLFLSVEDTGVGMSRSFQEKVFEPYTQEDATGGSGARGTGLGMSICNDLCTLMGGTIGVESDSGKGSTFLVGLPVEIATEVQAPSMVPDDQPRVLREATTARVLVVDDNEINRLVIARMLTHLGIQSHIVCNGLEAVEAWQANPFDTVLMDVHMPVMDGPTAAKEIRTLAASLSTVPQLRIIAVTADAMPDQVTALLAHGFDGHLEKPIQVNKLAEVF